MLRVNSLSSLPIQRKLCAASIFSFKYQGPDVCLEINAADQAFVMGPCVMAFYACGILKSKPEVVDIKTKVNIICWHLTSCEPTEAGIYFRLS